MLNWTQLSRWNKFTSVFFSAFALAFPVFVSTAPGATPSVMAGTIGIAATMFSILLDPASYNGTQRLRWHEMPPACRVLAWIGAAGLAISVVADRLV